MTNLDSILKSRDITLPTEIGRVKGMVFPVVMYTMWELDHEEGWAPKNRCFQIVVLEDSKESKPVHPKGNQSWIFTGRTDAEAEAQILWPPDVKNQLIGKDLDAGKDWRPKETSAEDKMVRSHCWLSGHDSEQTLGDSEGQGSLVCCSPLCHKESGTT